MEVKKETVIRTVLLVIALLNQILVVSGRSIIPVSDDQITEVLSIMLTVGASVWAWWKNNSFTKAAIEADKVMEELKANKEEE